MLEHYLIAYDICDPKRLRRVHQICSGYGDPIQLSVFECQVTPKNRVIMEERLKEVIDNEEDQVLVVKLPGKRSRRLITSIGRKYQPRDLHVIIC